jgi:hypothetical protein
MENKKAKPEARIIHIKEYNREYYKKIGILRKYNKDVKHILKTTPAKNPEPTIKKVVDKIIVYL